MDYTIDAIRIPRRAFVAATMDYLGPPSPGPTGALFSWHHLIEMHMDNPFYVLRGPDNPGDPDYGKLFIENFVKPRLYVPNVKDCDNLGIAALDDLSDAAKRLGWGANGAFSALAYDSKMLAESGEPYSGYHVGLFRLLWIKSKKQIECEIVQPKYLDKFGNVHPETYHQREESRRWVFSLAF